MSLLTTHETPSIILKLELSQASMEKNTIQLLCGTFSASISLSEKQNITLDGLCWDWDVWIRIIKSIDISPLSTPKLSG